MKPIIQSIKNKLAEIKLRYSRNDDGLYLFFYTDPNASDMNEVWLTTSIAQNIVLKKKNSGINWDTVKAVYPDRNETVKFKFDKSSEYVIYISKANRLTKITLDDTTVYCPLENFSRMTSLQLLSIMNTNITGNINELKKLPFLSILCVSSKYIKGINKNTFNNWPSIKMHEVD